MPDLLREIHRLRSEAHEALFRMRLLTRDPALEEAARSALEAVTGLHDEGLDRAGPDARRTSSKQAVEDFVTAAARYAGEPRDTAGARPRALGRRPAR
ncbi:hypothetical protein V1L54_02875 [Streptomyces sp. TRM 70361]|uniref:hypothetical protein n=1 Tax=Streptomyces sp. TRM 70361 TaxID=3116553 RepID=UPI002E7C105D|nr:hypothetical protein [Streptomyces sp. TRM 70361]MEE1938365.1 hypothetical protein [Streptomyces sp. TRM 70361]